MGEGRSKERPGEVDLNTEKVTFDVKSLYTSIPKEYGLKALGYFLTTFEEDMNSRFNDQFALDDADLILNNNLCTFDYWLSLQIKGTTTDKMFVPPM